MITGYQAKGFIGSGVVLIDELDNDGNTTGEFDTGETSLVTINPLKITKEISTGHRPENYGQNIDYFEKGRTQDMKITFNDATRKILAMFLYGRDAVIDVAAETNADELIVARKGMEVKLAKRKLKGGADAPGVKAVTPSAWQATHVYALGAFVSKVAGNEYRYECTTAGESGAEEPVWPTEVGETIEDGAAVFTCRKLTYVESTDYEIDYLFGTIKALDAGAIVDKQPLEVTSKNEAYTGYKIVAATRSNMYCGIRVKGVNQKDGTPFMITLFKTDLAPAAGVDFITDKKGTFDFTGDIYNVTGKGTWVMESYES